MSIEKSAEECLRQEVSSLEVDELLALCYTFQHKPERLRLYLDVLRGRGGARAQFASCLICFDLARQGDPMFQKEFTFLADTMRVLAQSQELVQNLTGGDPYLSFLWDLCAAQLEAMDPRFAAEELTPQPAEVATFELLTDDDFEDIGGLGLAVDDSELWLRFDRAIEDFLGGQTGTPIYDAEAGFRVRTKRDVERVERFLLEMESLRSLVKPAGGFRALGLLFYGTHLRSRSLFGGINERKQQLLRDGIAEFIESGPRIWEIAGVIGPLHAAPGVWEKIGDLLDDYVRFMASSPAARLEDYDVVGRLIEREPGSGNRRGSARE